MKEYAVVSNDPPEINPQHEQLQAEASRLRESRASTTVAKAIFILELLASKTDEGITLAELSSFINMPKSSTYRYLITLEELGLAERKEGDRFIVGAKIIELAGNYLAKSDVRNESMPVMNELAEITGETVHLAVPYGIEVVYIAKIASRHTLGMSSYIGSRLPMYCTALGKAILAFGNPRLLDKVLQSELNARTNHTQISETALRTELIKVRSQGFALDNEENEAGICCVGAPILDFSSKAIAAISISGPSDRLNFERAYELGPLLLENTQKISRHWGYIG